MIRQSVQLIKDAFDRRAYAPFCLPHVKMKEKDNFMSDENIFGFSEDKWES